MHLYVLARGNKDRVDRWVNDCLARYYPYKYSNKEPPGLLQLSVRPIQLYEIVFPKNHLNDVLSFTYPLDFPITRNYVKAIRKILGLKKINMNGIKPNPLVNSRDVAVTGIGIKEDSFKNGIEQI